MTGSAGWESNLSAILGRSVASLRAEAPVMAVAALLTMTITFGAQMAPRMLGQSTLQGWPLLLMTGLTMLVVAPINGLVVLRVLRREAGNVSPVLDDVRRIASLAGAVLAIALLLGAPSLFQLSLLMAMIDRGNPAGRAMASLMSLVASIATVILYLNWPLASAALLDRQRGLLDALQAGRRVLKGHRWLLIGVFVLVGILFFIPQSFVIYSNFAARTLAAQNGELMGYAPWQMAYISAVSGLQAVVFDVILANCYLRLRAGASGLPGGETAALFD